MKTTLTIEFPTEEARRIFATWLCNGGGEQHYFRAMEESSTPNIRLGYHGPENEKFPMTDRRRYGQFLEDSTIRVTVLTEEYQ